MSEQALLNLENADFKVTISTLGAELQSIYNKRYDFDYLWDDAGRGYWSRHAPLLFPFIGRSNQDSYLLNGQTYSMTQHGFIRDQIFTVSEIDVEHAILKFTATAETRTKYPFDFDFVVRYSLTKTGLVTTFEVTNNSTAPMPFALGSHPGFNVVGDLSDYMLTVESATEPVRLKQFGIKPTPFRDGQIKPLTASIGARIPLNHKLLDDGLIILANTDLTSIKLDSSSTTRSVKLSLTDFPYVAIWSPENKKAPFVCVEPFAGLPDEYGQPGDMFDKLGNTILDSGDNKEFKYTLTLA
ncbi:aldose 1-epimerase family protein [Loigolactobacillus coryniformis]|uniref:aldose 1-epimerase family protein n=1 Tax=Loigolactobacillus coryniformis TaxID=1610 RepID=UPI001C5E3018|nr:aldose 1-epimerase family protein [Loigolactobacillus coryniformis]MBW4803706.1 aldose 1-epimerase family protein [Loigolactobacillus coryniformis subsp. torquens]MBW4806408.1 aldose 1-epimerase family protein [Loigolactobacillus coryniformis subsp. torquens]